MPHVTPLAFGMAAGLAAAFFSSISYLISRHHGTRRPGGSRRLLVLAHLLMGLLCVPVTWWLLPETKGLSAFAANAVWLPCLISTLSYFGGQACLFHLLTRADASRLSPLLGLKIVAQALLLTVVLQKSLAPMQWLAILLCGAAALVLQQGKSGVTLQVLGLLALACFGFAIADLEIVALIDGLEGKLGVSRLRAGTIAMSMTYVLGGLIMFPLAVIEYRRRPGPEAKDWLAAMQYSAAWMGAMVTLYACIGSVGVILSTILQSTRGIMSVVLGAVLAHHGWHELESRVDRSMLIKRIIAAALMTGAIGVYVWQGTTAQEREDQSLLTRLCETAAGSFPRMPALQPLPRTRSRLAPPRPAPGPSLLARA
jgi:drug/metabolite transporter (DMT)-like permease